MYKKTSEYSLPNDILLCSLIIKYGVKRMIITSPIPNCGIKGKTYTLKKIISTTNSVNAFFSNPIPLRLVTTSITTQPFYYPSIIILFKLLVTGYIFSFHMDQIYYLRTNISLFLTIIFHGLSNNITKCETLKSILFRDFIVQF